MSRPARQGDLAAAIAVLAPLKAVELRTEWERVHGSAPSARLRPDMLRRGIGYKLQEAALGGLSGPLRRRLASLADGDGGSRGAVSIPAPSLRLKPGATLLRDWQGRTHTVLVREDGFDYQGRRYNSLTQIVRVITGTHWSGPRFFGLQRARRLVRQEPVDHVEAGPDAAAP